MYKNSEYQNRKPKPTLQQITPSLGNIVHVPQSRVRRHHACTPPRKETHNLLLQPDLAFLHASVVSAGLHAFTHCTFQLARSLIYRYVASTSHFLFLITWN